MKERPILMNGAMVRAVLDGSKTQTRRILKRQPCDHHWSCLPGYELRVKTLDNVIKGSGPRMPTTAVRFSHHIDANPDEDGVLWVQCAYGQPGDRIWARETWRADASLDAKPPRDFSGWPVKYEADGAALRHGAHFGKTDGKTRVSMHMPRWASRILLEIVSVRVERLQDIIEVDALAEGVRLDKAGGFFIDGADGRHASPVDSSAVEAFKSLWESTGGDWDANPWCWAITFKRVAP